MKNVTAAVEFGTSKVMCVIGREKSMGRFEVLGAGEAKYEGIKNGRWQKPSNVEQAVEKAVSIAEKKAKKRIKEVFVGVPGVFCKVVCQEGCAKVDGGRVVQSNIERLIEDAEQGYDDSLYTVVNSTPVYYILEDGHHYIDVIDAATNELHGIVSLVFAKNEFIEDTTALLQKAGVKVAAFIPEVLAESLFLVPAQERDCSSVLINVGYYDTNVTVVYGDAIVYNKTIHAGGMQMANDLSIVMNLDVDMAEQVKKRYSFGLENSGTKIYDYARQRSGRLERFSHTLVSEVIDARVEHLCQLIGRAFEKSPLNVARRTRIYLSGGGIAMMKGVRDMLQGLLKRQVRISAIEAPQLSTPNYYTVLALLHYVFEAKYHSGSGGLALLERLSKKCLIRRSE
jgi:cell division protein FtsA